MLPAMKVRPPARVARAALRRGAIALAIGALALSAGCARVETIGYPETTWTLDDGTVVSISTYAVGHRPARADIPYLYESVRAVEAIYFQISVGNPAGGAGADPQGPSILIRSLTYQGADAPPVTLISDYASDFWMQDNPNHNPHNPEASTPVPCVPGQSVTVRAELQINDQDHALDAVLTCESRASFHPLMLQSA
jgi:hypothetical protein